MDKERTLQPPVAEETPLVSHLTELRTRIIWSLVALGLGIGAALALVPTLLRAIIDQAQTVVQAAGGQLFFMGLTEVFGLWFRLGVWLGIVLALPVILYQIVAFVLPALMPGERRLLFTLLPLALLLFAMGAAFGYLVLLPATLQFILLTSQLFDVPPLLSPRGYVDLVVGICLPMGIAFELPVVVWLLASLGLISGSLLRRLRRFAVLAIVILAAFITPGGSPVDQGLMAIPLLFLYEISILIASRVERRRAQQEAAAE